MNRTNFHTHTYRCGHAEGTERDYVEAAAAMGMPRLGMSDHGAYPDDSGCNRMPYSEVDEYIGILASLKKEFASRLELFIGFELEYIPEFEDYYRSLIEERGVDYLALGQHIFTPPSGELVSAFGIESSEDYIHYARSVADGMRTGIYDFVAHPDLMYFVPLPRDINFDRAADIIDRKSVV